MKNVERDADSSPDGGNGRQKLILYFKVILLAGSEPNPHRIIATPAELSMPNFLEVVAECFDLALHQDAELFPIGEEEPSEDPAVLRRLAVGKRRIHGIDRMRVEEALPTDRSSSLLLYGSGSEIVFLIRLVRVEEYPCVIERFGDPSD
jgi:hypothetical protein